VAIASAVHAGWAAFGHSNFGRGLRFLEPVLITPRLHRLHHVPATSETNLGSIFSIWDRLRGTLTLDPNAPLEPLGVAGEIDTYPQTWAGQFVEPMRFGATTQGGVGAHGGVLSHSEQQNA
jgi:sterol desaturase/sphingolipid hydroxylase (fatty acid hydroxylase superfamily)